MAQTNTAPAGRFERIAPLLRPNQVEEMLEDQRNIEATMRAPAHISGQITDRAAMRRQMQHIKAQLHENAPEPYVGDECDQAKRRLNELEAKILPSMPTQAEMRRNPSGAVDKHRGWEKRHKHDVLEWKNIRLRMHASGMLDEISDAQDVANIERLRPRSSSQELLMHGEQIAGKMIMLPPGQIESKNHASDEDRASLLRHREGDAIHDAEPAPGRRGPK